ncbi:MAG: hypothetical protein KJ626_06355 [Verrucomicrobia bacterium]|nr:hypothetical protein [Verrucomicrobiota bacterium]
MRKLSDILTMAFILLAPLQARGVVDVYLQDVPDYAWKYGCFGTTVGMVMGYWDRHGYPNAYTGSINSGTAPLNSLGGNTEIWTFWATRAGYAGRAVTNWGHVDDYWGQNEGADFESPNDPFRTAGRTEHAPDCIGDFIGLSQYKWTNMNGECSGNLNGYVFNYWDTSGAARVDYRPGPEAGPELDAQSGIRDFFESRGYRGHTVSSLSDTHPLTPAGSGYTFSNYVNDISAGYPVVMMQQDSTLTNVFGDNPKLHAVLGFGYRIMDDGTERVRLMTSWGTGYSIVDWDGFTSLSPPYELRGVITFKPDPEVVSVVCSGAFTTVSWHGPQATLYSNGTVSSLHSYVLEGVTSLVSGSYNMVAGPLSTNVVTVTNTSASPMYYRVRKFVP